MYGWYWLGVDRKVGSDDKVYGELVDARPCKAGGLRLRGRKGWHGYRGIDGKLSAEAAASEARVGERELDVVLLNLKVVGEFAFERLLPGPIEGSKGAAERETHNDHRLELAARGERRG